MRGSQARHISPKCTEYCYIGPCTRSGTGLGEAAFKTPLGPCQSRERDTGHELANSIDKCLWGTSREGLMPDEELPDLLTAQGGKMLSKSFSSSDLEAGPIAAHPCLFNQA